MSHGNRLRAEERYKREICSTIVLWNAVQSLGQLLLIEYQLLDTRDDICTSYWYILFNLVFYYLHL